MNRRVTAFVLAVAALAASFVDARAQSEPAPERHEHIRCLTPYLVQQVVDPGKLSPSILALLNSACPGPTENGRPLKQRNALTPSGHFRVHFDTSGTGAVNRRDVNQNGLPDYIDSVAYYLDMAWSVEIDEYGYTPPPSDNRGLGPEIDVYICGLSQNLYGGAQPESDNLIGQNPVRAHGYLMLDNDYAGYPTAGIDGLRVTTAHEFHHIVQFSAYRLAFEPYTSVNQQVLYEATATWFEKKVHPDLEDYRQYVDALLRNPHDFGLSTQDVSDQTTGYAHMLYLEYLEKRFGRDVVRKIWEQFRTRETFDAINAALGAHQFNLSRSYCEFGQWSYHTGHRSRDTAFFKEASRLPALRAAMTTTLTNNETSFEDELYPLSFGLYRLLVPTSNANVRDTVDFLLTNSRSNLGAGGPSVAKEPFRIDISRTPVADYIKLNDSLELYYRLVSLSGASVDAFCLDVIKGAIDTRIASVTSPQPFINRPGEYLLFAVDAGSEQVQSVRVAIYTVGMARVAEFTQTGLLGRDNQLGVLWDGLDQSGNRAPSGVYFYELAVDNKPPVLGKIAVVRE